jgi:methylmalonyl-CoA carboxyltransferase large subunit
MASSPIEDLRRRKARLYLGGGKERIAKQHAKGKRTARERLALLFDADSFQESHLFLQHRNSDFDMLGKEFPGEGVVTGFGLVDGRPIYAASQDFTVAGGAVGEATARKIHETMDQALRTGDPIVFINDSGGARIQEGIDSLAGYGGVFYRNILLSGVVPQISIISGPCAGGAAYSPALTDFIIQVEREGQLYITGPSVVKQVTGEDVTSEELGGFFTSWPAVATRPLPSPSDSSPSCRATTPKIRPSARSSTRMPWALTRSSTCWCRRAHAPPMTCTRSFGT